MGENSDIRIAHCPERVLPGRVMEELITNDRVIGGMTRACSDQAVALYKSFVSADCVVASSTRVAEMAKLTENSFRDVNIAFANELSLICDQLEIDVWELIRLANRHPRVNILQPGPGVGGHCIAVDPWFVVSSSPDYARLIKTAREVNDSKPEWVLDKVQSAIGVYLSANPEKTAAEVVLAVYGLAFKPDIDDLRESPALAIARFLESIHAGPLLIVEPFIEKLPPDLKRARLVKYSEASLSEVNVLLVDHTAFKSAIPPAGLKVDCRGVW
jgi:UDP-N-acetyl-D-mannosaminuronic acid dehydrogenase